MADDASAPVAAAAEELAKLRQYKQLTKVRMKQAAEKLAQYRIQLETSHATIAELRGQIADQAQEIAHLKKEKNNHNDREDGHRRRPPPQARVGTPLVSRIASIAFLARIGIRNELYK
jgi:hypothetical protein